jgi:hypothetical protein
MHSDEIVDKLAHVAGVAALSLSRRPRLALGPHWKPKAEAVVLNDRVRSADRDSAFTARQLVELDDWPCATLCARAPAIGDKVVEVVGLHRARAAHPRKPCGGPLEIERLAVARLWRTHAAVAARLDKQLVLRPSPTLA